MICKKGGFISIRHNIVRDIIAKFLEKVCPGVQIEPFLLAVENKKLPPGTNLKDGARLDIVARGFWSPLDKAFFDVRVLHPGAASNDNKPLEKMYKDHEEEKKRTYNHRIIEVEHGHFTPLVMSTTGGMSREFDTFIKRLSSLLSMKTNQKYADTVCYVRRRLRIELLKTCLIAIRGHRGRWYQKPLDICDMDLNLINNPMTVKEDESDSRRK